MYLIPVYAHTCWCCWCRWCRWRCWCWCCCLMRVLKRGEGGDAACLETSITKESGREVCKRDTSGIYVCLRARAATVPTVWALFRPRSHAVVSPSDPLAYVSSCWHLVTFATWQLVLARKGGLLLLPLALSPGVPRLVCLKRETCLAVCCCCVAASLRLQTFGNRWIEHRCSV